MPVPGRPTSVREAMKSPLVFVSLSGFQTPSRSGNERRSGRIASGVGVSLRSF